MDAKRFNSSVDFQDKRVFYMSKDIKRKQLGMDPGTASNRLVKDILWSYIVSSNHNFCHHCGTEMDRDDFSIEHKEPWLHSDNPKELFFNLDNISFSHKSCNYSAARRFSLDPDEKLKRMRERSKRKYWNKSPEERKKRRREQYLRTGT